MHRLPSIFLASLVTLLGSLSLASAEPDHSEAPEMLDMVGWPDANAERPHTMYQVIPAHAKLQISHKASKAAPLIIYMNKDGGIYTPGINDSTNNRSSVPLQTVQILPWNVPDAGWQEVMGCVQDLFSPFNVTVTDQDPSPQPHLESIVAGSPTNVGLDPNVAGVSPFTNDCSVIPNSIVYTFAEVLGTDYRFVCEVAAQEIAHSIGLDHQFHCPDPMTYLNGCGAKTFQNVATQCGEYEARTCLCGQQSQNSVQMLLDRIGPRDGGGNDSLVPTVGILSPADGALVAPGFVVTATAEDETQLSRVELYIDDQLVDTMTAAPFMFVTNPSMTLGSHRVETRAYDTAQNVAVARISINVSNDVTNPTNPAPTALIGGCQATDSTNRLSFLFLLGCAFLVARRRRHA